MKQQICEEDYRKIKVDNTKEVIIDIFLKNQMLLISKINDKIPSDLFRTVLGSENFLNEQHYEDAQIKWMEKMIACMHNELEEVREWLPWKTWKHYDNFKLNKTEIKYEIIDLFFFLMEMVVIMGMDAEEFLQIYQSKLNINHDRQDNNYGKETK